VKHRHLVFIAGSKNFSFFCAVFMKYINDITRSDEPKVLFPFEICIKVCYLSRAQTAKSHFHRVLVMTTELSIMS